MVKLQRRICSRTTNRFLYCYVSAALLVASYQLKMKREKNEEKKRRRRRWWVRPWMDQHKGHLHLIHHEFKEDPEQFKVVLRLTEANFNKLLNLIEHRISKRDTLMRSAITPRDKLTITLRFLATGETYISLMYAFRVAESTISLFVPTVCTAIYEVLRDEYLQVPSTAADWLNIAKEFQEQWHFPNTIGALDGKHIVFSPPKAAGSIYYNYKHQHSIVLLALVDANYYFRYIIDVGVNGRVSDGGVFRQSTLYAAMHTNSLNLPEDRPLPGRLNRVPHVIVADAAFPLSEHILKPFPFRNMSREQRVYNYRLSRARRVVENAFGILANRFRVFLTTINLSPEKVQAITLCCCALHNFLLKENPNFVRDGEEYDRNYLFKYALAHQGGNRPPEAARDIRVEFMNYVNGEGAVHWQDNAC